MTLVHAILLLQVFALMGAVLVITKLSVENAKLKAENYRIRRFPELLEGHIKAHARIMGISIK